VKDGTYGAQDRFSNFDLPFAELCGKTWGIIGMGNIGKSVARIAEAFGCRVIFHSVTGKSTCTDYEQVSFDALLEQSDILSLQCPLSELTRNLIDAKALSRMKSTAVLVNVARGPVVNNRDLYTALENGTIAVAGLDVLEKEPIAADNPLDKIKDSNKLIITPHMAWASTEARIRLVEEVYKNINAFLQGEERNLIV
jgi:glycerate dehydrogenase